LRILEIGTWLGGTAIAMADALQGSNVHCVDTWEGSPTDCTGECAKRAGGAEAVYAEFLNRIGERLNESIFPWQMDSKSASEMHWDKFDVIFIDAEHTYDAVKADILNWWEHLRDDGIMVGHDYETKNLMGVTQAVRELFGSRVETFGWDVQGGMWKVRKSEFPNGLLEEECRDEKKITHGPSS
jgi:predicted O-methyltransferase YrrM